MKRRKILIICPYPEGVAPSQRLKFEQYYSYFRENGFDVTVSPFISTSFWKIVYKKGNYLKKIGYTLAGYARRISDVFRLRKYHVVYIHLWVTPLGPPFFEWLYYKLGKRIVYDIDDLVYLPGVRSDVNPIISGLKGKTKPLFLMRNAHHVITCTPYLDEVARKYNSSTTDISSTINTDTYQPKTDYSIKDQLILGWSGSVSTIKHFRTLEPVLKKLKDRGHYFRLLVMGDETFRMEDIETEALSWKESYEVDVIKRFDIGLYPLPDEPWVYGKSGLKALQYMAVGVPVIATAIGTNFRIIENEVNGYLASNEDEWLHYLEKLMADRELRKHIGMEGRRIVEEKFSVNANKETYLSIINKLFSFK